jgi:hypothetical protein
MAWVTLTELLGLMTRILGIAKGLVLPSPGSAARSPVMHEMENGVALIYHEKY